MDHLCYLCLLFVMLQRLFITALWSPAGKCLTSWLLFVMFNCVFVTFPCGILGQVWYLIVLIPDLCCTAYFYKMQTRCFSSDFNLSVFIRYSMECKHIVCIENRLKLHLIKSNIRNQPL